MKGLMTFSKSVTSLVLLVFSMSLVSCGNDGDNGPRTPLEAIKGNYNGKMITTSIIPQDGDQESGAEEGVNVAAKVDNEYISFDDLPVRDIVISIVGADKADEILNIIGKVSYKIAYKATINEEKDNLSFVLNPEPLHLELTVPGTGENDDTKLIIDVEVSALLNGNYDIKTTDLKFNFAASKVMVNDVELQDFTPTSFDFKMNKAK